MNDIEELNAKIEGLEKAVESKDAEVADLKKEVEGKDAKIEGLEKAVESLKANSGTGSMEVILYKGDESIKVHRDAVKAHIEIGWSLNK